MTGQSFTTNTQSKRGPSGTQIPEKTSTIASSSMTTRKSKAAATAVTAHHAWPADVERTAAAVSSQTAARMAARIAVPPAVKASMKVYST